MGALAITNEYNTHMSLNKVQLEFVTTGEVYISDGVEGQGATSIVYRVRDSDGARWALKCLRPEQATRDRTKRFLNELYFCQSSGHKNVIQVIDHGFVLHEDRKCPFYVMPLYPSTLRKALVQGIPPNRVLHYFSNLLDGVEAAHLRGVIHRDLKPENVMHDPAQESMVVSDFGTAHFNAEAMFETVQTGLHDRLANFQYAAPEQRRPGMSVDHRADIYALGLMLNEMFTGQVLQGTGFARIASAAPDFAYLDEIVDRMVQHSATNRQGSIDEIKLALIARRNEFVSRQKLDELKREVIPSATVSHPLLAHPPRVVDVDIRGNTLTLYLDKPVTREWEEAFRTPRNMGFIGGSGPDDWRFERAGERTGASVRLPVHYLQPETAQPIIDNFKSYVEFANVQFRKNLEYAARSKQAAEQKALQDRIVEEEKRRKLLDKLKI